MNSDIPYEYGQLQLLARQFIDTYIRPLEKEMDGWGGVFPRDKWQELLDKSRELGLYGAFVPAEWGGGGIRSCLAHILVYEEIGKFGWIIRHLFDAGFELGSTDATRQQIEKYFVPVWRGEKCIASGITEPDAGSDNMRMQTTAVRRGDMWVLNGTKCFLSVADRADIYFVFAKTDVEKRRVSCFLVDRDTPGVRLGRHQKGMSPISELYELYLDDVAVPAGNLVGEEGRGMRTGFGLMNFYRLRVGSLGIGAADYAIQKMVDYAKQRVTFSEPLANRQTVQAMIVDSWMEMESARWFGYHCATRIDEGAPHQKLMPLSATCKVLGTELACRALDRAIQVHGGVGYTADLPLERMYRELRGARIFEGANEVLKHMVIARNLLGD